MPRIVTASPPSRQIDPSSPRCVACNGPLDHRAYRCCWWIAEDGVHVIEKLICGTCFSTAANEAAELLAMVNSLATCEPAGTA